MNVRRTKSSLPDRFMTSLPLDHNGAEDPGRVQSQTDSRRPHHLNITEDPGRVHWQIDSWRPYHLSITEDPSSDQLPLPDYDLKAEVEQTPLKGSIRELLWESPSQTPRNRRVVRREVVVSSGLWRSLLILLLPTQITDCRLQKRNIWRFYLNNPIIKSIFKFF